MVIAYSETNNVSYHIPIINRGIPHLTTLNIERCRGNNNNNNNNNNKPSGKPDLTTVEIIYNRRMKPTSRHRDNPVHCNTNTESNLWYYMVHQFITTNKVSLLTYTFPTILYYKLRIYKFNFNNLIKYIDEFQFINSCRNQEIPQ